MHGGAHEHSATVRVIDLHIDRPFRLNKDLSLSLGIDIFNVFNEDAATALITDINDQIDSGIGSTFGQVTLRQPPRKQDVGQL